MSNIFIILGFLILVIFILLSSRLILIEQLRARHFYLVSFIFLLAVFSFFMASPISLGITADSNPLSILLKAAIIGLIWGLPAESLIYMHKIRFLARPNK